MLTIDDEATFIWDFGQYFFLETSIGNFIWSYPDYGGDNTITPFNGNYVRWLVHCNIPYGRYQGCHVIQEYCGPDVKIIKE